MSKRRKPQKARTGWQPLERAAKMPPTPEKIAAAKEVAEKLGITHEELKAIMDEEVEMWRNDLVTVVVTRDETGAPRHLSIRRNDRKPLRDWPTFQRIKNQLAGENVEAVELFPAEDRLIDMANQYHLWCLPPGESYQFGFNEGRHVTDINVPGFGAVQRRKETTN